MSLKKVIVFDLDDTLSKSKVDIQDDMVDLLCQLLEKKYVAVISGASFHQLEKQLISHMDCADLNKLYILPVSGSQFYKLEDGKWELKYSQDILKDERERIIGVIYNALEKFGFDFDQKLYGDVIIDKGTGVTASLQGTNAPLEVKKVYDPDRKKREEVIGYMKPFLPEFSISIGGKTSIDVTPIGIDKAFGITKLSEMINIPLDNFLFIGDALYPGGNDSSVNRLDVDTIAVDGNDGTVVDTSLVIKDIIEGKLVE